MFRPLPVMQSVTFQKITAVIDMTQIISDLSQMRDLEGDQVDVRIHGLCDLFRRLVVGIDVIK